MQDLRILVFGLFMTNFCILFCALQYLRRLEGYGRRKREIVRAKAPRRAALNDTNGVRAGAHDAKWEAGLSLSLPLSRAG